MSILIKGMEMPYNCGHCFLRRGECKERIYMPNRPSNCPLIPVPPHGDLIDKSDLMKLFQDEERYGYIDALDIVVLPTIIEAEGEE